MLKKKKIAVLQKRNRYRETEKDELFFHFHFLQPRARLLYRYKRIHSLQSRTAYWCKFNLKPVCAAPPTHTRVSYIDNPTALLISWWLIKVTSTLFSLLHLALSCKSAARLKFTLISLFAPVCHRLFSSFSHLYLFLECQFCFIFQSRLNSTHWILQIIVILHVHFIYLECTDMKINIY